MEKIKAIQRYLSIIIQELLFIDNNIKTDFRRTRKQEVIDTLNVAVKEIQVIDKKLEEIKTAYQTMEFDKQRIEKENDKIKNLFHTYCSTKGMKVKEEKMKGLFGDLEFDIWSYFEAKIQEADIPEREKDRLYNSINLTINEVKEVVKDLNNEIDSVVENFSPEGIRNELDDIRTQDWLERV